MSHVMKRQSLAAASVPGVGEDTVFVDLSGALTLKRHDQSGVAVGGGAGAALWAPLWDTGPDFFRNGAAVPVVLGQVAMFQLDADEIGTLLLPAVTLVDAGKLAGATSAQGVGGVNGRIVLQPQSPARVNLLGSPGDPVFHDFAGVTAGTLIVWTDGENWWLLTPMELAYFGSG